MVNMPDPDALRYGRAPDPGPRRNHWWNKGETYPDRETAERVALDIVERDLVRNASVEPA